MKEAHKELMKNVPEHQRQMMAQLKVPDYVGGSPDLLLGIRYQSLHPEVIFQMPSGLFIGKLRLKSHDGVTTGVIGGPHSTFSNLSNHCGSSSNLVSCFVNELKNIRSFKAPRITSVGDNGNVEQIGDDDDNFKVRGNCSMTQTCMCCCSGHCVMQPRGANGVSGVTVHSSVLPKVEDQFNVPYIKELVKDGDFSITHGLDMEAKDELFAIYTSFETNFNLN